MPHPGAPAHRRVSITSRSDDGAALGCMDCLDDHPLRRRRAASPAEASPSSGGLMEIENLIRYAPRAVGLMKIKNINRYSPLAVGLKPSAIRGKARLRGLYRT